MDQPQHTQSENDSNLLESLIELRNRLDALDKYLTEIAEKVKEIETIVDKQATPYSDNAIQKNRVDNNLGKSKFLR